MDMVAMAGLLVIFDGNPWKRPSLRRWYTNPDAFLLLYIAACVISFLFSSHKTLRNASGDSVFLFGSGRYDGFLTLLLYIAIFFAVSRFGQFKDRHTVICAVTAIVMCAVGVLQLFGLNPLSLYANFLGGITKFVSTVGNMGMFSGMFCLFVPLFVTGYVLQHNRRLVGAVLLVAEFLSVYVLFELGVTAGKLALVVMMAVLLPFMLRKPEDIVKVMDVLAVFSASLACSVFFKCTFVRRLSMTRITLKPTAVVFALFGFVVLFVAARFVLTYLQKKETTKITTLRLIAVALIAALVLFLVCVNFTVDSVAENNQSGMSTRDELAEDIQQMISGEATDSSGSFRFGIWKNALELGGKHWLFGTGIGTFVTTFEEHIAGTDLAARLKAVDVAHNEYLHLFCTVGLFGLLAYLGFLITLAIKAFSHADNPRILILGSAVLCYAVQAFFSFNIVIITPLFWLCAGLLYSEIRKAEE